MWEDMVTYWAWRGDGPAPSEPPTEKVVLYARVHYPEHTMAIADAVEDDGVRKLINQSEIMFHIINGATVDFHAME